MALLEDVVEFVTPNALVAVGVILLSPFVLPVIGAGLRPVAKGAIKGYLTAQDKVREYIATSGEGLSDLVAEAKAEHAAAVAAASGAVTEVTQEAGTTGTEEEKYAH